MKKKGVIFDLDGTVVENNYDWRRIREEIGAGETSILTYLESLEEPEPVAEEADPRRPRGRPNRGGRPPGRGSRPSGPAPGPGRRRGPGDTTIRGGIPIFLLGKFGLEVRTAVITRESGLWETVGRPFLEVIEAAGSQPAGLLRRRDTRFDVLAGLDAGIAGYLSFFPMSPRNTPASRPRSSVT